jgi:hypothetical protein
VDISVEVGGSLTELALVAPGPAPAPGAAGRSISRTRLFQMRRHQFPGELTDQLIVQ